MSKQNSNNLAMPFSNEPLISDIIKVLEKHLNFNKIQDSVNKISQPDIQESEISIETSEEILACLSFPKTFMSQGRG